MQLTTIQKQMAAVRKDDTAHSRHNTEWNAGERVMVSRVYPASVIGRDDRFPASYFVCVDATGTTKSVGAISLYAPESKEDAAIHPREY